ncbi:hypothetical protein IDM40_25120 [Nocardiopsis sp. HNM0947]|uniref:Secreted protein n=1 Tax=Nocardiopsis coralli TaxID=2772213 RepID=A0ABR9PDR2_9ACTN|nr:hypothetical protein [Nocardiopsis coralli]MBE3001952.1 hypothetical protein [Nocardiopsis coralli]
MFNPIALLCLLVRMVRASQGVHISAFGYVRELAGEVQRSRTRQSCRNPQDRRNRSRRVRRYAERIPRLGSGIESGPESGPESESEPGVDADSDSGLEATVHGFAVRDAASVNVSVPAAIVRGRCFVSGRATGARPVESRKLALAVLCALADQDRRGLGLRGLDVDLDPGLGLDPRALDRPDRVRPDGGRPDRVRFDRVRNDRAPGRDMLVVGEAA